MAVKAAELAVIVGADTAGAERGLQSVDDRLGSIGRSATITGGMLTAGLTLPLAGAATTALTTAMDYQSSMAMFQAVSEATAEQMAAVGDRAKELGADMTLPATSAGDAAAAMTELVKAGLSVEQSMAAAKGVLQLAAAGNLENARAAEIAANALNAFKLPGEEATSVANLLAAAANASSIEVTDAADSLKMAGAVFAAFQGPVVGSKDALVDLTTAIALMGNMGIKGSDAGTSLKQMLLQLTGPSDKAKDSMRALYLATQSAAVSEEALTAALSGTAKERGAALGAMEEAAGATAQLGDIAYDASGRMRPLREIIDLTARATAGMSDEQRNLALTTIFGADATRAVIALMREGEEGWNKMEAAVTRQNAAADLAGARMAGLRGALAGLGSQVETVMLQQAEPFLGTLEGWVRGAADLVPALGQLDPVLVQAGVAFAAVLAAAGPATLAFGAMAAAIGFLLSPLGLVVAAVATFAAAYTTNFMGVRDITNTVVGAILGVLGGLVAFAQQVLAGDWAGAWATATGAAQIAWDNITAAVTAAWPIIQGLIQAGLDAIGTLLSSAWESIKGVATGAWNAIADFFRDWWGTILFGIVTGGMGPLALFIAANWDTIKTGAEAAWSAIAGAVTGWVTALWNGVTATLDVLPGWLADQWGTVQTAANAAWQGFWQTVTDWASKTKDDVIAAITAALDFIKAGPSAWMDAGKALITGLVDGIRSIQIPLPKFEFGTVDGPLGTKIPKLDIGVDWKSIGDLIPALASGGDILRAGLALVGERGPELLHLPRGARVTPLPPAARVGAGTVNVYVTVQGSVMAERDLAATVRAELLKLGRRNLNVGLS